MEAEIVDEVQAKVEAVVEEEPEPDPVVKAEAAPVVEAELEESGIKDGDNPIVKAEAIPEDIDVEKVLHLSASVENSTPALCVLLRDVVLCECACSVWFALFLPFSLKQHSESI